MLVRQSDSGYQYLLQKRADDKYHSGGLWSNSCCSHPRPGEDTKKAVQRRAIEELGIDTILPLEEINAFVYRSELDNNLIEHEFDHVFLAIVDELNISPNPEEIAECRWWSETEIAELITREDAPFTAWFKTVFESTQRVLNSH